MTITTVIRCDNCSAAMTFFGYSADPYNVVLRACSRRSGWKFDSDADGGHLCPDCDDYDEEAQR